ncbi:MAG: hypothetical protein CL908_02840 [Deltaproteobacteria bacterium]|nr:hypothetical protein [Deltaproteobacteria bacterium]
MRTKKSSAVPGGRSLTSSRARGKRISASSKPRRSTWLRGARGGAVVIALGGGAVAQPGAVERLRASGDVVFLEADPEELVRRIEDGGSRPLLAGLDRGEQIDRLRSLLSERMPFYAQAHHRVDAAGGTFEVVDRIVAALQTG